MSDAKLRLGTGTGSQGVRLEQDAGGRLRAVLCGVHEANPLCTEAAFVAGGYAALGLDIGDSLSGNAAGAKGVNGQS